jgi:hypothetical protein
VRLCRALHAHVRERSDRLETVCDTLTVDRVGLVDEIGE